MRAVVVDKKPVRFAMARLLSSRLPEQAISSGPLTLRDIDSLELPGKDWVQASPLLAGICGSDLALVSMSSSRYFEPLTSFPFVPGHEIVASIGEHSPLVVVEPALTCVVRDISLCSACQSGATQRCESLGIGKLAPGIQLGYCSSTGGGWAQQFIAHKSQLHPMDAGLNLEDAVMIEPLACAVHAALTPEHRQGNLAIIGGGTVGLSVLAASHALGNYSRIDHAVRYPIQRDFSQILGADTVVSDGSLFSRARRLHNSARLGGYLGSGYDTVIDAVGSSSSLEQAVRIVRPGGQVVVAGMPHRQSLDLAPLWHREVTLTGTYAYGTESIPTTLAQELGVGDDHSGDTTTVRTFALAIALAPRLGLGRLVTHRYALADYTTAIAKAQSGGQQDAVKVVFDLRMRKGRHDT